MAHPQNNSNTSNHRPYGTYPTPTASSRRRGSDAPSMESLLLARGDATADNDTRIMLQMLLSEARRYHAAAHRNSRRAPVFAARSALGTPEVPGVDGAWHLPTPMESPDSAADSPRQHDVPAPPPDSVCPTSFLPAAVDHYCDPAPSAAGLLKTGGHVDTPRFGPVAAAACPTPPFFALDEIPEVATGDIEMGVHHQHNAQDLSSMDQEEGEAYDGWTDLQAQIEDAWVGSAHLPASARYTHIKNYLTYLFIWDTRREWDEFEQASPSSSRDWIASRQAERLRVLPQGQLFLPEQQQQ